MSRSASPTCSTAPQRSWASTSSLPAAATWPSTSSSRTSKTARSTPRTTSITDAFPSPHPTTAQSTPTTTSTTLTTRHGAPASTRSACAAAAPAPRAGPPCADASALLSPWATPPRTTPPSPKTSTSPSSRSRCAPWAMSSTTSCANWSLSASARTTSARSTSLPIPRWSPFPSFRASSCFWSVPTKCTIYARTLKRKSCSKKKRRRLLTRFGVSLIHKERKCPAQGARAHSSISPTRALGRTKYACGNQLVDFAGHGRVLQGPRSGLWVFLQFLEHLHHGGIAHDGLDFGIGHVVLYLLLVHLARVLLLGYGDLCSLQALAHFAVGGIHLQARFVHIQALVEFLHEKVDGALARIRLHVLGVQL
mmetsp:Transcript_50450/g.124016  ORF Transcript_50450/g.124016 Transcript_50450/m.124016 type:complete len:365 (+) Transcript_50450:85-1179(+)